MKKVTQKETTELLEKIVDKATAPWAKVPTTSLNLEINDRVLQTLAIIGFVHIYVVKVEQGEVMVTGRGFEYLLDH